MWPPNSQSPRGVRQGAIAPPAGTSSAQRRSSDRRPDARALGTGVPPEGTLSAPQHPGGGHSQTKGTFTPGGPLLCQPLSSPGCSLDFGTTTPGPWRGFLLADPQQLFQNANLARLPVLNCSQGSCARPGALVWDVPPATRRIRGNQCDRNVNEPWGTMAEHIFPLPGAAPAPRGVMALSLPRSGRRGGEGGRGEEGRRLPFTRIQIFGDTPWTGTKGCPRNHLPRKLS